MNLPFFSIIMSTHNRRDLIPRAIESVLSQTEQSFELLVIDNGSRDDTECVVRKYEDQRVRYFLHPHPSLSCDQARSFGLSLTQGLCVSFLDDDNIWYPGRLEKVRRVFFEQPYTDVVCHNENIRKNNRIIGILKHNRFENLYETLLYDRSCFSPCAIAIKKSFLDRIGGYLVKQETEFVSDYALWFRILENKAQISYVPDILGEFCLMGKENGSFTNSHIPRQLFILIKQKIDHYENHSGLNKILRALIRLWRLRIRIFKVNLLKSMRITNHSIQ